MTERKPPDMSFTSWIDQQIGEAQERGEFDNLPGAGKPLPRRSGADDGLAWVRELLRREGLPTDELLPTPLKLRSHHVRREGRKLFHAAELLAPDGRVLARAKGFFIVIDPAMLERHYGDGGVAGGGEAML